MIRTFFLVTSVALLALSPVPGAQVALDTS